MSGNVEKHAPFFFTKPSDAIVDCSKFPTSVRLPPHSADVQWETELVVTIGKSGMGISPDDANEFVFGYTMGVDLTARDLQSEAKKKGRPWDLSKGFDSSGPIGSIIRREDFGIISNQRIRLEVNGIIKQESSLDKMILSVPYIIHHLSNQICLREGDLIFTGTPKGVGKLNVGDEVKSIGDGLPICQFQVIS